MLQRNDRAAAVGPFSPREFPFYKAMLNGACPDDLLDRFPEVYTKLRPGVPPLTAATLVRRLMIDFYSVVFVVRVPNDFGKDEETGLGEIAGILEHGDQEVAGKL